MNIIITGASRGIGYQTAKYLAALPGNRVLVLTRNTAVLADDPDLLVHELDVCHFNEKSLLQDLASLLGRVDILINNAGALVNKPFAALEETDWEDMLQTNLLGPVRLVRALLPLMGQEAPTHIVNIGSMGGYQGSSKFPGLSAYSASKAALANLTECLAEELKDRNIRVNCLCLGAVDTDMLRAAFPEYKAPVSSEEMGRFVGSFALEAHRFYNGKILPVSLSTP